MLDVFVDVLLFYFSIVVFFFIIFFFFVVLLFVVFVSVTVLLTYYGKGSVIGGFTNDLFGQLRFWLLLRLLLLRKYSCRIRH